MTRIELSQKICEGISTVFGRPTQNPDNWLYEQDFVRGHVAVTEHATSARDAMAICTRLEETIGCGVKVSSTSRADESYVFTIDFTGARDAAPASAQKSESVYKDGNNTVASIEKDGKKYMVNKDGKAVEVEDPDKYVANLNKTTGSNFRKAEDLIDARIEEAMTALTGTGCTIKREDRTIRIKGAKSETLSKICESIPGGDDYYGSGFETCDDGDCVVVVLPSEIFGVEELLQFIDKAVVGVLDDADKPEPKDVDSWVGDIEAATPDANMARRLSFMKSADGLALAMSDEKFAQAVASVRDAYGNDKAEALMTLRFGARKARAVIEALGTPAPKADPKKGTSPDAFESLLDNLHRGMTGSHRASPGVSAIIASQTIKAK